MEGKGENKNNLNPADDANRIYEDSEYIFNDPKIKRPNTVTEINPTHDNNGLTKNLQAAGLNFGVC